MAAGKANCSRGRREGGINRCTAKERSVSFSPSVPEGSQKEVVRD